MSEIAEKMATSIGRWETKTYLGILSIALLAALFGRDIASIWRGGDPDHIAIKADLVSLAKTAEKGATTSRMQALAIQFFICNSMATGDGAKQQKCFSDHEAAIARINAEIDRGQAR